MCGRSVLCKTAEQLHKFFIYMDNQYREYLISKKWEWYKKAIHHIYNDECYICNSCRELHVHHKTYERIYHEDLDDLVLLCKSCHEKVHNDINRRNFVLKYFANSLSTKMIYNKYKKNFWKEEHERKYISELSELFDF